MSMTSAKVDRGKMAQLLLELHLVDESALDSAILEQRSSGKRLSRVLAERRLIDEERLAKSIAGRLGLEVVGLANLKIHDRVLQLIPPSTAARYGLLPIAIKKGSLDAEVVYVVMSDPLDAEALSEVQRLVGREVRVLVGLGSEVDQAIVDHYASLRERREDEARSARGSTASTRTPMPGKTSSGLHRARASGAPSAASSSGSVAASSLGLTRPPTGSMPRVPAAQSRTQNVGPKAVPSPVSVQDPSPRADPSVPPSSASMVTGTASSKGTPRSPTHRDPGEPQSADVSVDEWGKRPIDDSDLALRRVEVNAAPSASPSEGFVVPSDLDETDQRALTALDPGFSDDEEILAANLQDQFSTHDDSPLDSHVALREERGRADGVAVAGGAWEAEIPARDEGVETAVTDEPLGRTRGPIGGYPVEDNLATNDVGAPHSLEGVDEPSDDFSDAPILDADAVEEVVDGKDEDAPIAPSELVAVEVRTPTSSTGETNRIRPQELLARAAELARQANHPEVAKELARDAHKHAPKDLKGAPAKQAGKRSDAGVIMATTLEVPVSIPDVHHPFTGPALEELPTGLERTGIIPAVSFDAEGFSPPVLARDSVDGVLAGAHDIPESPDAVRARIDPKLPLPRRSKEQESERKTPSDRPISSRASDVREAPGLIPRATSKPEFDYIEDLESEQIPIIEPSSLVSIMDGHALPQEDTGSDESPLAALPHPRQDLPRPDSSRGEGGRLGAPRIDPARSEPTRTDPPRSEPMRTENPRIEPSRLETRGAAPRDALPRGSTQKDASPPRAPQKSGVPAAKDVASKESVARSRRDGRSQGDTSDEEPTNPRIETPLFLDSSDKRLPAVMDLPLRTAARRPTSPLEKISIEVVSPSQDLATVPTPPSASDAHLHERTTREVVPVSDGLRGPDDASRLVRDLIEGQSLTSAGRAQLLLALGRVLIRRGDLRADELEEELRRGS